MVKHDFETKDSQWTGAASNPNFAMEYRLKALDPELHRHFTDGVVAIHNNLNNYKWIFPEYTDHTSLHSLSVINFCNQLIGKQIERLNADELYVLLMGCYFHDAGMGISDRDYQIFSQEIAFGDYFKTHTKDNIPAIVRDFHQEFSACFIRRYAFIFEIPSEEHIFAIVQVARGHRKTDLFDVSEYPSAFRLKNGNGICLPYLSALIRLADEIDVAADRNPLLLYDIKTITDEVQIMYNKAQRAVKRLDISEDAFTLYVDGSDPSLSDYLWNLKGKMQATLDYCRKVIETRTPYTLTQNRVELTIENT